MSARASLLTLSLALLGGCAADFIEPWDITEPRLAGARVEVVGDPARPRPRLGESFTIDQYLVLPAPLLATSPRYDVMLTLCLGQRTATGELACIGEQSLAAEVTQVSDVQLRLSGLKLDFAQLLGPIADQLGPDIDLANLPELADLDRIVLFGVVCVDGRAERVPLKNVQEDAPSSLYRCVDNAMAPFPAPTTFTLSVLLDRGRPIDANRSPAFACDPAEPTSACATGVAVPDEPRLGGELVLVYPQAPVQSGMPRPARVVSPWPASVPKNTETPEGCSDDPGLLKVRAGDEEHTIRMRFDASDRERYSFEIEQNGRPTIRERRESLLLSHAITRHGGELERYFSELGQEDADELAEISFGYTPPAKESEDPAARIPETGRRVRFYFTLRDQRGGVDFTTRELCVLPGVSEE